MGSLTLAPHWASSHVLPEDSDATVNPESLVLALSRRRSAQSTQPPRDPGRGERCMNTDPSFTNHAKERLLMTGWLGRWMLTSQPFCRDKATTPFLSRNGPTALVLRHTPSFICRPENPSSPLTDGVKNGCARKGDQFGIRATVSLGLKSFVIKRGSAQTANSLLNASKTAFSFPVMEEWGDG